MSALKKISAICAALALAGAANAGVVIDDFSVGQAAAIDNVNGTGGNSTSAVDAGIFGGQRELFADRLSGALFGIANQTATEVASGALSFTTGSGTTGMGIVRWDGAGSSGFVDTDGSFGINKNGVAATNFASSSAAFALTILSSDAGFPFTIQAFSGNSWSSLTIAAVPVCVPGDALCLLQDIDPITPGTQSPPVGPVTLMIDFSSFAGLGATQFNGGADFSGITALQAIFNHPGGTSSIDFSIDLVERVPEPASIALVGVALLGAGMARRRKLAA